MIDWGAFDWQSFATLTAGALAVVAAATVGWRQNAILEKQAELAEFTLRHDLFERRYAVYEATRDYLLAIMQMAEPPSPELERKFLRMQGEARFLFRASVQDDLQDIWKRSCDFAALTKTMKSLYRREGHYGEGNPARESEMLSAFSADLERLPNLFGDEMKLGGE